MDYFREWLVMSVSALLASYGLPTLIADAADFDGTNDYMARGGDLTGIVNGKSGILSFWYRVDGGDGGNRIVIGDQASGRFWLRHSTGNLLTLYGYSPTGSESIALFSNTAYTTSASWLHVLMSWDLATTTTYLYINDVSDKSASSRSANLDIDYTLSADLRIGAQPSGAEKINGCLAEFYFSPGNYLDLSIKANRRRFITADGKPAQLGIDGSVPTGTAPILYLHLDNGEAVENFATNRGTGGNFTITGTLDAASTSPTD
jgi:hypothetical protein